MFRWVVGKTMMSPEISSVIDYSTFCFFFVFFFLFQPPTGFSIAPSILLLNLCGAIACWLVLRSLVFPLKIFIFLLEHNISNRNASIIDQLMLCDWFALRLKEMEAKRKHTNNLQCTAVWSDRTVVYLSAVCQVAHEKWTILTLSLNIINWKPIKWEHRVNGCRLSLTLAFSVSVCVRVCSASSLNWWDLNLNLNFHSIYEFAFFPIEVLRISTNSIKYSFSRVKVLFICELLIEIGKSVSLKSWIVLFCSTSYI